MRCAGCSADARRIFLSTVFEVTPRSPRLTSTSRTWLPSFRHLAPTLHRQPSRKFGTSLCTAQKESSNHPLSNLTGVIETLDTGPSGATSIEASRRQRRTAATAAQDDNAEGRLFNTPGYGDRKITQPKQVGRSDVNTARRSVRFDRRNHGIKRLMKKPRWTDEQKATRDDLRKLELTRKLEKPTSTSRVTSRPGPRSSSSQSHFGTATCRERSSSRVRSRDYRDKPGTPSRTSAVNAVDQGSRNAPDFWKLQKKALTKKFGDQGWAPRKKLSPDALEGIRALHALDPKKFSTPVLADQFEVSPEAIRRILKSKWRPNAEEEEDRLKRWSRRGEHIWDKMSELGVKPPKKWREMGVGESEDGERPVWKQVWDHRKNRYTQVEGEEGFDEDLEVEEDKHDGKFLGDRIL